MATKDESTHGRLLARWMDQVGVSVQMLADACGRKWPTVNNWKKTKRFSSKTPSLILQGIAKLNADRKEPIDPPSFIVELASSRDGVDGHDEDGEPGEPEPAAEAVAGERFYTDISDLTKPLDTYSLDQLRHLHKILDADTVARRRIQDYIAGSLNVLQRHHKS